MSNLKAPPQYLYLVILLQVEWNATPPLTRDQWNLILLTVHTNKNEANQYAIDITEGGTFDPPDLWVVRWEMTQGDNVVEAFAERGLPPWIRNPSIVSDYSNSPIAPAIQLIYTIVYIKQVDSVWRMFLYSVKSVKNNCWEDVRVLRAQGFATWAVKHIVVYGTDIRDALGFWGLE